MRIQLPRFSTKLRLPLLSVRLFSFHFASITPAAAPRSRPSISGSAIIIPLDEIPRSRIFSLDMRRLLSSLPMTNRDAFDRAELHYSD